MLTLLWFVAVLVGALALAYVNASGIVWSAAIAVALAVALGRASRSRRGSPRARRGRSSCSRFR